MVNLLENLEWPRYNPSLSVMMDVKSSEAAEEPKRDVDQSAAVEY